MKDIFSLIHRDLPQEGPGSDDSTKRALEQIPNAGSVRSLLDLGCGPGRQTMVLLNSLPHAQVTAVDLEQSYLNEVKTRAQQVGAAERLTTLCASMENLDLQENAFDLIWSEGAIYIIGFDFGLRNWKTFLCPGGYLAVTELSWLGANRPEEAVNFWTHAYPQMRSVDQNKLAIHEAGYEVIGDFTLPESDWWTQYYTPMENRIRQLINTGSLNKEERALAEAEGRQIDLYRRYSGSYGYHFYIMRKPGI